jgi:drug/metabolite transporter (DMT)-like permease
MEKKQEKVGVIFSLVHAAMYGTFAVLVNRGAKNIPPITFAALTTLLAACGTFVYVIAKGKLHELKKKESYRFLVMITLCIVIIPYILFFVGASKTSSINSSLLLLSEIIFTLLFTPFIGEKTTIAKLIGALGIFLGALFILYNGVLKFNVGDLLIIASTLTYPIGNYYAKRALNLISPATILFVRFLFGGLFILAFALIFEPQANAFNGILSLSKGNWALIIFTGLILLGLGKIICYEGLKRLDISKNVSIGMTFPLFSLIVLIGIFKESPSVFQWIGIFIMAVGVYFSIKRPSVDPALTKYAR